ncbi:MAG: hypothetical protein WB784_07215 [Rhodanobacteraceae bacterium]
MRENSVVLSLFMAVALMWCGAVHAGDQAQSPGGMSDQASASDQQAAAGDGEDATSAPPAAKQQSEKQADEDEDDSDDTDSDAATSKQPAEPERQAAATDEKGGQTESPSRLSNERAVKIDPNSIPKRPPPLLELGSHFLGTGPLPPGYTLPTGEVIQPQLTVFGTFRSALQSFTKDDLTRSEWANRFDLFANLSFTSTERLVAGVRPLDRRGEFAGYIFQDQGNPANAHQGVDPYNGILTTLFFEGDFGEIFPKLDPYDRHSLDYGFAIGRQPLSYQDGILINDTIDSLGIIRNDLLPTGGSNLQLTFVGGWNQVNDGNGNPSDAHLYGLFTQADYPKSTFNGDFVYVNDVADTKSDAFYWGISASQRIGKVGTIFRFLGSHVIDNKPLPGPNGLRPADNGELLTVQANYVPAYTENNLYADAFLGINNFTSAARGPATGGPLGAIGILFASFGIGNFNGDGAALGGTPSHSWGGAVGYQIFSHDTRRQYIIELGGRHRTDNVQNPNQYALGVQLQQALGRRFVVSVDGFRVQNPGANGGWGARVELLTQF